MAEDGKGIETIQEALRVLDRLAYEMSIPMCGIERLLRRQFIIGALERNRGHRQRAAKEVGLHRNQLRREMVDLKIQYRNSGNESRTVRPPERPGPKVGTVTEIAEAIGLSPRVVKRNGLDVQQTPLALKCRMNQVAAQSKKEIHVDRMCELAQDVHRLRRAKEIAAMSAAAGR